jgi:hypothetical protein
MHSTLKHEPPTKVLPKAGRTEEQSAENPLTGASVLACANSNKSLCHASCHTKHSFPTCALSAPSAVYVIIN